MGTNHVEHTMLNIVIFGTGGHARVVAEAAGLDSTVNVVGFVAAKSAAIKTVDDLPVLGADDALLGLVKEHNLQGFVVGVGDNHRRAELTRDIMRRCPALQPVTITHPTTVISAHATVGLGTVLLPGATVNCGTELGAGCIVNTNATIEHDCQFGAFASVGPGATVGGSCQIGVETAIGIGATVSNNISIGTQTVVGAGAVVVRDLPDRQVAYGNPAKPARPRQPTDAYM